MEENPNNSVRLPVTCIYCSEQVNQVRLPIPADFIHDGKVYRAARKRHHPKGRSHGPHSKAETIPVIYVKEIEPS